MIVEIWQEPHRAHCRMLVGEWYYAAISDFELKNATRSFIFADAFQHLVDRKLRPAVWLSMPGHE